MSSATRDSGALLDAIAQVLHRHPAGISEYELIRVLRSAGQLEVPSGPRVLPHELFRSHFLVFHALYRLRDRWWQAHEAHLEINPLKIRRLPYTAGERALGTPDGLREYYLDMANLETTSAEDVNRLIASFQARLQRQDRRAGALAELDLQDPIEDEAIKEAWRRLAMEHHPDRGGDAERLQAINAAVAILLKRP
ncbi:MAG: DnaJ domain-containing protein [Pseudomonadota bacterium]|nr:MAG: DnaJ domain-containing protein [Pseudomonadota bacterium]